jgi:hypothetical protein
VPEVSETEEVIIDAEILNGVPVLTPENLDPRHDTLFYKLVSVGFSQTNHMIQGTWYRRTEGGYVRYYQISGSHHERLKSNPAAYSLYPSPEAVIEAFVRLCTEQVARHRRNLDLAERNLAEARDLASRPLVPKESKR